MTRDTKINWFTAAFLALLLFVSFVVSPTSCAARPVVEREFVPVPEPATYGLFAAAGLAVVVLLRRARS